MNILETIMELKTFAGVLGEMRAKINLLKIQLEEHPELANSIGQKVAKMQKELTDNILLFDKMTQEFNI